MKNIRTLPSMRTQNHWPLWVAIVLAALVIILQGYVAMADEHMQFQIFEVRKKLQMTSQDPLIRDYYVNAGQGQGLKEGAYVTVYRKTPLNDPYKQETQAHVEIPVGTMKVIFSDKTMSIGRIQSIRAAKESPVLDGDSFMVGDRIDMSSLMFKKDADLAAPGDSSQARMKSPKSEQNAESAEHSPASVAPVAPPKEAKKEEPQKDLQRKNASLEAQVGMPLKPQAADLPKTSVSEAKPVDVLRK